MPDKLNNGFIYGKTNMTSAKIILQALIGESALGRIQLYDTDGHAVPKVDCIANSDGYYGLNFNWDPRDLGKMVNTNFRGRFSVVLSTPTETTIVKDGIESRLIVAVSLGNIQFCPYEGFAGPYSNEILDEIIRDAGYTIPAILCNQIKMTPEMLVILGYNEIYL